MKHLGEGSHVQDLHEKRISRSVEEKRLSLTGTSCTRRLSTQLLAEKGLLSGLDANGSRQIVYFGEVDVCDVIRVVGVVDLASSPLRKVQRVSD